MPLHGQYSELSKVHYTVNDGLPSSTCYDLVQDKKGFLWVATEGGLTKYDGQDFKTFTTSDGLVDNEIVNLQLDRHDRLWMNTNGPITYIKNDSVYTLASELNSSLYWDFKVFEDEHNVLWISRMHSLKALNATTLEPINFESHSSTAPAPYFIAGQFDSCVWISHSNMLYKYKGVKLLDSLDLGIAKSQKPFSRFFTINSSFLYYIKDTVLYKYDLNKGTESALYNVDERIRQMVFKGDETWLLTENSLEKFSVNQERRWSYVESLLEGNICSRILFDQKDNLWTAIYKNGLMMFSPENTNITSSNFNEFGSNNLESILIDGDKILLGSEKGEIYEIENGIIRNFKIGNRARSSIERIVDIVPIKEKGYLVSADSGIYHFKDGTIRQLIITNAKNIFLKGEKVLINTYSRLYEANIDDLLSITAPMKRSQADKYFNTIDKNRSYTSLIDEDDNIWNANVITGLVKISNGNTFYFKSLSNLFNCTISRVIELDNGLICAVTKGEGLILIKGKEFKQIKVEDGLSSNFCYDVASNEGKIFVATNKGVSIVEIKDFKHLEFNIEIIDMYNGLTSNEVQDLAYSGGSLFMATNEGLVEYHLKGELDCSKSKEIFVTDFQVNGENQPIKEKYNLSASENNIRVNYISPNISSNENIVYAYKLEGVDEDWIYTTSKETHYSNLNSGTYKFKYKLGRSIANDANLKSIEIRIDPQFVESSMFKFLILSGLGLLFLLPLYLSYHSNRQNLLASLLQKKSGEVEDKIQLLEKSNTRLVSSNKELEQFAYIASHDLQEPINTIKGFSEVLKNKFVESGDADSLKMLDMISSSSTRMKSLVQALLIFSRIGKEKKKSMVDMNALMENIMKDLTDRIKSNNAKVTWGKLPYIPGYQVELRSLFQNLLSNAMKFQKSGVDPEVEITSRKIKDGVEFSVKDNGIGIGEKHKDRIFEIFQRLHNKDEYEGTGIGLAHCKKIVTLHHGDIWVESILGEGCNFKFTIETY